MSNSVKILTIADNVTGTSDSRPVGAEAENIDVVRNNLRKITDVEHQDTSETLNTILYNIEDKLSKYTPIILTQTLLAGETLVTFNNEAITSDKMYDIYTIIPGLNYVAIDDTVTNQLKITYLAQSNDIVVKLVIKNFQ